MDIPTFKTERLTIRPITINDAVWIQEKFNDWEIVRYLNKNVPWPYPENGALDFLENVVLKQMENEESYHWAICKKEDVKNGIGVLSFRHQMDEHDGHRGFWIERAEQSKGYVTEACNALNDFVFNTLKWDSFIAENACGNEASRRIKEKTGGVLIDEQTREFVSGIHKTEIWKITKEKWKETSAAS